MQIYERGRLEAGIKTSLPLAEQGIEAGRKTKRMTEEGVVVKTYSAKGKAGTGRGAEACDELGGSIDGCGETWELGRSGVRRSAARES